MHTVEEFALGTVPVMLHPIWIVLFDEALVKLLLHLEQLLGRLLVSAWRFFVLFYRAGTIVDHLLGGRFGREEFIVKIKDRLIDCSTSHVNTNAFITDFSSLLFHLYLFVSLFVCCRYLHF